MDNLSEEDVPKYLLQRYNYQVAHKRFAGNLYEFLRLQHMVWKTRYKGQTEAPSLSRWLCEEKKLRG